MPDAKQPDASVVTWRRLWDETTRSLGDHTHARWMCEIASGCDGGEFVTELDRPASHGMVAHLDAMIARRRAGEPLQYVLGRWQFRHLDLLVDRRVLIPRPETEWVCDAAMEIARSILPTSSPLRIVDLGTGSGAIGLAMAAELPVGSTEVWLTDESSDALDVARANLAGIGRSGAFVHIAHGSWFEALPAALRGTFDLIVSNPPYIAEGDPSLDPSVADWEPEGALLSGDNGLGDLRQIIAGARSWLRPGGALVLEIGAEQGPAVTQLLFSAEFRHVAIREDLAGKDRIAIGRRPT